MKISIVSPAHQNEDNIEDLVKSIFQDVAFPLKKKAYQYEVIIAEDGSTDNTKEILKRLQKKYDLKLLLGEKKLGYKKAVKNLFAKATGGLIFFLDSDGEIHPKSFWSLFHIWQKGDYDIVTANKLKRKPFYRFIISRINNLLLRILFNTPVHDANAGFRLYKKNIGKAIIKECGYLKYNFNSEQIIRAVRKNLKIAAVEVPHFERKSVIFKPVKLFTLLLLAFLELLKFRYYLNKVGHNVPASLEIE